MSITQIHLEKKTTTPVPRDAPRPAAAGPALWLNVSAPTEDDLAWLEQTYQFHPLTIEDCRNFNQRAKVEHYDGYLFLSLTTTARDNGELHAQEMECFLGPDYLITVHRESLAALDAVRERYGPDKTGLSMRPDFILYLIADHMVDAYFPLLDEVEDEIDALEDQILERATEATLHRIFKLKQQLVFLRKTTAPMRDLMNTLAGTRYGLIDDRTALYFRDVYDHLNRIYDLVETSRDLLGNALDAYLSTVSNRLNEVVKRLTIFTAIFMPISFLVGLGGINFQQMPFDSSLAFTILMALLVITPIGTLAWFWHNKWL
ncbi:MAG: magnesium/cobalt transporter CorA [Chloroflexi bacterium]|nr:magnesium/cobalt transporter CorA [Chloroflexota bacterium]